MRKNITVSYSIICLRINNGISLGQVSHNLSPIAAAGTNVPNKKQNWKFSMYNEIIKIGVFLRK